MSNSPTSIYRWLSNNLNGIYPLSEAQSLARLLLENVTGQTFHQLNSIDSYTFDQETIKKLEQHLSQLKLQKPIQYILREAHFFDLILRVSPDVLIPRPETEELVLFILQEYGKNKIKVLDIGTGSGCIAIALAKNRTEWSVFATDISEKAIALASENAKSTGVDITFMKHDILSLSKLEFQSSAFDVIVSNPPYVRESEKVFMQPNVLENEPASALFVPDSDPLIYYSAIAKFAQNSLSSGGTIFCEINEALGFETANLFKENGFNSTQILKDIHGKDRILIAKR